MLDLHCRGGEGRIDFGVDFFLGGHNDNRTTLRRRYLPLRKKRKNNQHTTEINAERSKIAQAAQSFNELESMLAVSRQQFAEMTGQRQTDFDRFQFVSCSDLDRS